MKRILEFFRSLSPRRRHRLIGLAGAAIIFVVFFMPPARFPAGEIVRVKSGLSITEVATRLQRFHLIRSQIIFTVLMRVAGGENGLVAGDYLLERPLTVFGLVRRLHRGEYGMKATKVTFPEGTTINEMAVILAKALPQISAAKFKELAVSKEGYLFPDTYFFLPSHDEAYIIETMENSFRRQLILLEPKLKRSGRSLAEIIIMASILEKELRPGHDRQVAAGILWKRLKEEIRLQVDVAKITYTKTGLPPAPITNPGVEAIEAALEPINSKYWYYLSGKDGKTHFAVTHEEHKANIKKYL